MDSERSSRPALSDFLTLAEFESAAQQVMAHPVYEYVAGGAGDEISLRANQAAFDSILLWPRVLRKVIPVETSTTLFGKKLPVPILLPRGPTRALCPPMENSLRSGELPPPVFLSWSVQTRPFRSKIWHRQQKLHSGFNFIGKGIVALLRN